MIHPRDFDIEIGHNDRGTFVRVFHRPTGNERCVEAVSDNTVARVRESLIAELHGLLYEDRDIVFDTGRSVGGDFIRVRHLPSGIERSAMRRDSTHKELLDAVLDELYHVNQRQEDQTFGCTHLKSESGASTSRQNKPIDGIGGSANS